MRRPWRAPWLPTPPPTPPTFRCARTRPPHWTFVRTSIGKPQAALSDPGCRIPIAKQGFAANTNQQLLETACAQLRRELDAANAALKETRNAAVATQGRLKAYEEGWVRRGRECRERQREREPRYGLFFLAWLCGGSGVQ